MGEFHVKKIIVFGAGNIGRSLVGQLFSHAGYEVVFVDVVNWIVKALNKNRRYKIEVKDLRPETILVKNVRAVHGEHEDSVVQEVATADIAATAVGPANLKYIYPSIAKGLIKRKTLSKLPLNIIICENIRNSSKIFAKGLLKYLPTNLSIDSMVGLVETSISKMVPIMTKEMIKNDPLLLYAEAYNRILLDKNGFKGEIPKIKGLEPKDNFKAYVDLKLFVHNLGHATTAYLGFINNPKMKYIWEAIRDSNIHESVKNAMEESGKALTYEYPNVFNMKIIREQIDNLVQRFNNKALGDTIFRVGRDIPRKLSRNDRLVGSLLLDYKHGIWAPFTIASIAAAMFFRAKDENGNLFSKDEIFVNTIYLKGIDHVLINTCGFSLEKEMPLIQGIKKTYSQLSKNIVNWTLILENAQDEVNSRAP